MRMALAREGAKTYRFLSGLYLKPPSDTLLDMIRDGSILSALGGDAGETDCGSLPPENGGWAEGMRHLREFVSAAPGLPNLKEELEAEHTALFALPSGVLPHEAVYRDKARRLGGSATIRVGQFYARAGTSLQEGCVEMADHLGLELEFMAVLCSLEEKLESAGDQIGLQNCVALQAAFLSEHLGQWAPACCRNVLQQATSGLYKALAHFTMAFLTGEEAYLTRRKARMCREEETSCKSSER